MRTFIAVPLPQECHRVLQQAQDKLRSAEAEVRWVSVPGIHLTLKFLGEIDPGMVPKLKAALEQASAAHKPFSLVLRSLGCFPNLHAPRVVWFGVEGAVGELTALQKSIEEACVSLGFDPEERPFRPHLTLGRVQGKRNLHRLGDYIKIGTDLECEFAAGQFNLYKSTLKPQGAIYSVLESFNL